LWRACQSVLTVCLSARVHISETEISPDITRFSVLAIYVRSSVLLWRRCDILSTSGCEWRHVSNNGPSGDVTLPQQHRCSVMNGLTLTLRGTGCVLSQMIAGAKTRRVLCERGAGVELAIRHHCCMYFDFDRCYFINWAVNDSLRVFVGFVGRRFSEPLAPPFRPIDVCVVDVRRQLVSFAQRCENTGHKASRVFLRSCTSSI